MDISPIWNWRRRCIWRWRCSARFAGTVRLEDLDPPNGYSINGEGQGGAAGFAKGGAKVALDGDAPDETVLRYEVHAQVGGKIAQLGGRLIDASAKQMADAFFDRFSQRVQALSPAAAGETAAEPVHAGLTPSPPISIFALLPEEPFGLPLAAWIGGGVYAVLVLLALWALR